MAGEVSITVIGNMCGEPELRVTSTGTSVASFTIASTPRAFDRQSGEWKDGTALFLRCSAWRELADHVVNSLDKGTRVIVSGRLSQREYEKNGQKRTVIEMEVDEIGPSLKFATVKVNKATREGAGSSGNGGRATSKAGRGSDDSQPPF